MDVLPLIIILICIFVLSFLNDEIKEMTPATIQHILKLKL